jgi:cytochrome c553
MLRFHFGIRACLVAAAVLTFSASLEAFQSTGAAPQPGNAPQTAVAPTTPPRRPAVSYEAAPENQRADLPQWPYTPPPPAPAVRVPRVPDDGTLLHIPSSSKAYTATQINNGFGPPDWFPDKHPTAPKPVTEGRRPVAGDSALGFNACGECHLMNGRGKSDSASLNGLPVAYILQQIEDFKNDRRHASVPKMGVITMIPVAKGITPEEAKEAAEYFASVKPVKWIRVVEANTVPKTHTTARRLLAVDEDGSTEPIGNRIIEVPENFDLTVLRDAESGFIAYVPVGSLKKGEALVKTGGNGKTTACVTCHGPNLKGMAGTFPPIAGRSPSELARQIYDFKTGARNGANAALMKAPVANLSDEDIVNITAYLASLDQ